MLGHASMTVYTYVEVLDAAMSYGAKRANFPLCMLFVFFFFFQAEDGIRDGTVTGVQTCALPICCRGAFRSASAAYGLHRLRAVSGAHTSTRHYRANHRLYWHRPAAPAWI